MDVPSEGQAPFNRLSPGQAPSDKVGRHNSASGEQSGSAIAPQSAMQLPVGGGAIRGITEKFQANPVTGTASLGIPLPVSPARGFEPDLNLSYDSGAGNSAFGLGWNVAIPSIGRNTEKGLPHYQDQQDSDTYTLGGAEDLVPWLDEANGQWRQRQLDDIELAGTTWERKLYRPRIEGSYARIERFREAETNIIWWRVTSGANVSTVYGFNDNTYLCEPGNRGKTFRWLADFSYDDKGHVSCYRYKREDSAGVDYNAPHEQHRIGREHAQLYLKKVVYGIKESRIKAGLNEVDLFGHSFDDRDFHFQTLFDYGDHAGTDYIPATGAEPWPARADAFSNYRATFEVRTYRRCERVLLFHDFPGKLSNEPELIRALELNYDLGTESFSFLTSIISTGYKRNAQGELEAKRFPAVQYEYQAHQWSNQQHSIDAESLAQAPQGVDGDQYQWADLYGEGLSGILTEQAGQLFYKHNEGAGQFSRATAIAPAPSLKGLGSGLQLQDLESNGIKALVASNGVARGYYTLCPNRECHPAHWQNFVAFDTLPNISWDDPNLRIIDLNGNGKADILISEERVMRWYPSKGTQGYGAAEIAQQPDEQESPGIIFSNQSESIFTADMSGDGLTDIVRVRNGSVVYWPNLGFGRFGPRVVMSNAPWFNHPEQFTPAHIRLVDLDGSGTADIVYLGKNEFRYWLNNSGNSWSGTHSTINPFPNIDILSSVSVVDLLGTGTACVVWSSPAPGNQQQPMRYIDLMDGKKPHLMTSYKNGFGKTVKFEYTASTQFYLEDKANGEPWVTRLHFPVHCLSKVETIDHVSGARFVSDYSYHHGYYDHAEREFRGFGRVDQRNTEDYEHFVKGESSNVQERVLHQTPVLVKTWYHNGAYLDQERILERYEQEYYTPQDATASNALSKFTLAQPALPETLSAAEWREALRACKGLAIRTETYGLDGSHKQNIPFSIALKTVQIKSIQPRSAAPYAVFELLASESVGLSLDRNPADPRVSHSLILESDVYGRPIKSATLNYGRKLTGPEEILLEQQKTHCVISEVTYTDDEFGLLRNTAETNRFNSTHRLPVTWKTTGYELGLDWSWSEQILNVQQIVTAMQQADLVEYLRKDGDDNDLAVAGPGELRRLACSETRFANDDLTGELPAGKQNALGISWRSFQLAFTPDLIEQIYEGRVDPASMEGGYIDLHGNGDWWVPSGHSIYAPGIDEEISSHRFYLPIGSVDALGACAWTGMDEFLLLPVSSSVSRAPATPANNYSSLPRINESIAVNDYRTLSAKYLRDVNHNWSAVDVDALGLVTRTAVMGKAEGASRHNPPANDAVTEGDNLDNPSTMLAYGFYEEASNSPAYVRTISWTEHYSVTNEPRDNYLEPGIEAPEQQEDFLLPIEEYLKTLNQFEYLDGSGSVFVTKVQSTPGIAMKVASDGALEEVNTSNFSLPQVRWISSGRAIINNAGNVVKQFEPFFSATHAFEDAEAAARIGISSTLFYDAASRNIAKLNPNTSYEKVVFDAWQQQSWDANDTLYLVQPDGSALTDITADPEVGHLLGALAVEEVSPSWYQARVDGHYGSTLYEQQQNHRASAITEMHVATPTTAHSDALGRTVLTIAHNRKLPADGSSAPVDEYYITKTCLDIESNMSCAVDARKNTVMSYRYNMLPPPDEDNPKPALYQHSMDGGEMWTLPDILGKVVRSWDSRDHEFENTYDKLNRPLANLVKEGASWKTIGLQIYVDDDVSDADDLRELNLLHTAIEAFDQAGHSQIHEVDFKGNVLSSSSALAREYKTSVDWSAGRESQLEDERFTTTAVYDALGRVTQATSPHNQNIAASTTRYAYNEAGALNNVFAAVHGGSEAEYVANIEYNAKGQRTSIRYGNGVLSNYEYENDTHRLKRVLSKEGNKVWQDLNYTYDPVGNITAISDLAQTSVIHGGEQTDGHRRYVYDPLYRLVQATGREHVVQAQTDRHAGWQRLQTPLDPNVLTNYTQSFRYDEVGNIQEMSHQRSGSSNGWRRLYHYAAENNRLEATTLGADTQPMDETYSYNAHGSMTSMNHLPQMDWDFAEQLRHVDLLGGGDAYYVYGAGGERVRKVVETIGTTVKERIYLAGWEIYRERNSSGVVLARETLHIMDDQQRIALLETKTLDQASSSGFSTVVRYQLSNHLGSATLELGEQGANGGTVRLISYEEFHPYGTTAYHFGVELTEASAKRYRYTGKERDEETGFSYHGARYLCNVLTRWISCDPIGIGDGLNVFRYVRNNPVVKSDPSGCHEKDDVTAKLISHPPAGTKALTEVRAYSIDPKTQEAVAVYLDVVYVNKDTGQFHSAIEAKDVPSSAFRPNQGVAYPGLLDQKRPLILDPAHTPSLSGVAVEPDLFHVVDQSNVDDFVAGKSIKPPSSNDIVSRTEPGKPNVRAKGTLKSSLYDSADNWAKGVTAETRTTVRRRDGISTRLDQPLDAAGRPKGPVRESLMKTPARWLKNVANSMPSGRAIATTIGAGAAALTPIAAKAGPIGDVVEGVGAVYEVSQAPEGSKGREVAKQVGKIGGGIVTGIATGAVSGGGLALVGGQAGPQAAAPEELVTVPLAATAGGFVLGAVGGYYGSEYGGEIAVQGYDYVSEKLSNATNWFW